MCSPNIGPLWPGPEDLRQTSQGLAPGLQSVRLEVALGVESGGHRACYAGMEVSCRSWSAGTGTSAQVFSKGPWEHPGLAES
jgi:hypothetical protein